MTDVKGKTSLSSVMWAHYMTSQQYQGVTICPFDHMVISKYVRFQGKTP